VTAGHPVWRDQLDERELAALRPGVPENLDRCPDVLVVGGGAQGLAAAAACRALGLGRVVLIERESLAAGPSGSAAGVLCPDAHLDIEGPAFVEFARESLARHEALAAEAGDRLRLRWLDRVVLTPPDTIPPPGAQRVDAAGMRRLIPALGVETAGLLFPRGQAHLNPQRLAAVLASSAGVVATGIEHLGLRTRSGRVEAVRTSHGELQPGAVLFATGLAPPDLLPLAQVRVKGHLVATEPAPGVLPVALSGFGVSLTPLEDGRLLAGGDQVPDDGSPEVDPHAIESFRAGLSRLLPSAATLRLTHAWSCARPATADRLPVIGRAPGLDNVWLTAGHFTTGLLLAPAAGHAIASWISSGVAPPAATLFRVDRQ
jgi:glycine oxidase